MIRGRVAVTTLLALGSLVPRWAEAQGGSGAEVGDEAPSVVVLDLDKNPLDLATLLGQRPVLLEFWATWCEQCAALLPHVREVAEEFGDQVEFIGINVAVNQPPARVRRYLERHSPPFRTLYDDQGVSVRAYRAPTTSYIVIIDREGTIVYTGVGADQDLRPGLRRAVQH